jgi:hypothetical protein
LDKRAVLTAIAILLVLASLFYEAQICQTAKANFMFIIDCPTIKITSPYHQVYCSNNLTVTFWTSTYTRNGPISTGIVQLSDAKYSLDGKTLGKVREYKPGDGYTFALTNLSEGQHTVSVTATASTNATALAQPPVRDWATVYWTGPSIISDSVTFTIDTVGPSMAFVQPQNKTYNTNTVALNFTSKEPLCNPSYSLDGAANQPINNAITHVYGCDYVQFTLDGLKEGSHTLTAYAYDAYGNVGKAAYSFVVDAQPFTANLAESASAVNFGDNVNFTVTVHGGQEPYAYIWHLDDQLVKSGASPYYATDAAAAGSHHMYVQVIDGGNNTSQTLTVEFTVLPYSSALPSLSSSPTLEPTIIVDNFPPFYLIGIGVIAAIAVIAAAIMVYLRKRAAGLAGVY